MRTMPARDGISWNDDATNSALVGPSGLAHAGTIESRRALKREPAGHSLYRIAVGGKRPGPTAYQMKPSYETRQGAAPSTWLTTTSPGARNGGRNSAGRGQATASSSADAASTSAAMRDAISAAARTRSRRRARRRR